MKLPAYLVRTSYGYAFRLRVPLDLLPLLPAASVKRSLRGYTLREAQLHALTLATRYARLFSQLRSEQGMAKGLLETALEGAQRGTKFEIGADPTTGRPTFKTTPDDTAATMALGLTAFQTAQAAFTPAPAQAPAQPGQKLVAITAKKAAAAYLHSIAADTKPKTLTTKAAAVDGFVAHFVGATQDHKAQLQDCSGSHVGAWVQLLKNQQLAPNTVNNKCVYLAGFFKWAMATDHYPRGINIAQGHATFSKKQQQLRLKQGYRAFTKQEIKTLFDPQAFTSLNGEARWGALLGLYTGARVSELGQLRIADFGIYKTGKLEEDKLEPIDEKPPGTEGTDWVYAIRITDEHPNQSLKTADSRRDIFIHPDLIKLGILTRVQMLKEAGEDAFFPKVKIGNVNGAGNWLSKAFSAYRTKLGVISEDESTRKLGFHGFRKTVNQTMQRLEVGEEYRQRYLGHDRQSVHGMVYTDYCPTMLYQFISPISFDLDLDALKSAMPVAKTRKTREYEILDAAIPQAKIKGGKVI